MTVSSPAGAAARLVIVASAIIPWSAGTYIGLILLPTAALSTSLPEAYEILGDTVLPGMVMAGAISLLLLALVVTLALVLVGIDGRVEFDTAFSPWRTVRWAALVFAIAYGLSWVPSALLSLRLYRIDPTIQVSETASAPWNFASGVCIILGIAGLLISAFARRAPTRPKRATDEGGTRAA